MLHDQHGNFLDGIVPWNTHVKCSLSCERARLDLDSVSKYDAINLMMACNPEK